LCGIENKKDKSIIRSSDDPMQFTLQRREIFYQLFYKEKRKKRQLK
jgi:hypothetical protein